MISLSRIVKATVALGVVVGAIVGCGSASGGKNDQGTSFSLDGFTFANNGSSSSSSTDDFLTGLATPFDPVESGGLGVSVPKVAVKMTNALDGQGIRTQRIFYSYDIPGASAQPPSTSNALSALLAPAKCIATSSKPCTPTSLPTNFGNGTNTSKAEVLVVPPAIEQWLVFNRGSLPDLPFTMEVTAVVSGVTTAGDQLDSNPATLFINYTAPQSDSPASGSSSSAG